MPCFEPHISYFDLIKYILKKRSEANKTKFHVLLVGVWSWSVCIGERPGNAVKLRGAGVRLQTGGKRENKVG